MEDIVELQQDASVFKVVLALIIVMVNSISMGSSLAFSTTAAVVYSSSNTTTLNEVLDEEQTSWLMSSMQIVVMISILLNGLITEVLGRKKSFILGQTIILMAWVIIYFAPNFAVLITGRSIMGVGIGLIYPIGAIYLAEISLVRFRGTMAVMNTVTANGAFVYSLAMSAIFDVKGLIIMSGLIPASFLIFSYFLPESPLWLIKRGREEEAEKTLLNLRGPQYMMKAELEELKNILTSQQESAEAGFINKLKELKEREVYFPVLMMMLMFSLQPFSGCDTIAFYSLDIFRRANVTMNNHALSILVNSGFTIGYVISAMIMSRVPRKVQFISSGLFLAVANATLGFSLNQETSTDSTLKNISDALLPICVISAGLAYGLGIGPVLFSLLGEILPQKIKSFAVSMILSGRNMSTFLNLKLFPTAVNSLGLPAIFWIHSGFCISMCFIAFFLLPETQGKTLTELATIYEKKKPKMYQPKVEPPWDLPIPKEHEAYGNTAESTWVMPNPMPNRNRLNSEHLTRRTSIVILP